LTLITTCILAIPLGLAIGHFGKGLFVIPVANALRALPTLGLLSALALVLGVGISAPLLVMILLAIPPVLAGSYAGIAGVDRGTTDAAKSIGFTEWQVLWKVELPLAFPLIIGGIRSACTQIIATWTVAAFLPLGGLGRLLIDGLSVRDYSQMLAGSALVIALALVSDALLSLAGNIAVPRGVRLIHARNTSGHNTGKKK
jgi:osmoprotectant transport system permease protein